MSSTSRMLPTGSNLVYGDATVTSSRRHLSGSQFPTPQPKVRTPSVDAGWLGPEGSYGQPTTGGGNPVYRDYGTPADNPQY